MNKTSALISFQRLGKTVSFALLLKSMVGLSLLFMTLVGVAVPHVFGYDPSLLTESAAGGAGALLGAFLALKA